MSLRKRVVENPAMILSIKERIDTELFIERIAARQIGKALIRNVNKRTETFGRWFPIHRDALIVCIRLL